MRILLVVHYFMPYSVGGTEEYTYSLAREMMERGHDVRVFHGIIEQGLEDYSIRDHEYEGIPCRGVSVDLNSIDEFSGTWRQAGIDAIFERSLDEWVPDLVHIQHLTRLSLGIVELTNARGVPMVLTFHDYWMQCARGQRIHPSGDVCAQVDDATCAQCMAVDIDYLDDRRPEGRRRDPEDTGFQHAAISQRRREMLEALSAPDLLMTASQFTAQTFYDYGVEREILVMRYGANVDQRKSYVPTTSSSLRIGFIGRLTPNKGLEVLIDAFELLSSKDIELTLHGLGDESYVQSLRQRTTNPAVEFRGAFERGELPAIYAGFDVQVVPSTWFECSPLVVQDAFLFGKPLVVSDIGGLRELVEEGTSGLRFRTGDAADLASKLVRLSEDPTLVRHLAANLPAVLPMSEYMDAIEGLYKELAKVE